MRGAPQSGFASAMVRTRSASSAPTRGLPTRPRRDFQVQKARKLCRCQRIPVCGFTTWSTSLQSVHHCESHIQKARSSSPNFGRVDLRRSRASCCRSARFSSVRSVRVLSAARRAPNRASTRDIALPGSHDGRPSSSRDRFLARDNIALHGSHAARPSSSLVVAFWQRTSYRPLRAHCWWPSVVPISHVGTRRAYRQRLLLGGVLIACDRGGAAFVRTPRDQGLQRRTD